MGEKPPPLKKSVSTRLPADEYDRLGDYCDERGISKADALRRLIRQGLDEDHGEDGEDNEDDADREREGRLQVLARVGEKFAAIGTVLAIVAVLLNLTNAALFGLYVILATFATSLIVISSLGLIALLVLYGIEAGFFGHALAKIVPTPDREATA